MSNKHYPFADKVCPWWLAPTFDNPLRRLVHNPDTILAGLVYQGQTAFDFGCGMGYFTIPLAKMVGEQGKVIAIDLQEKMLAGVKRRAERAGVINRVQLHQARPDQIGIDASGDFALAFWMVHEVPDQLDFLRQVYNLLKPEAGFLIVEPVIHVTSAAFNKTVGIAKTIGFKPVSSPKIRISQAIYFRA